jgi:hypothetical protein
MHETRESGDNGGARGVMVILCATSPKVVGQPLGLIGGATAGSVS